MRPLRLSISPCLFIIYLGYNLDVPFSLLGCILDVPSRYFVFPKRVFLKTIGLYKSLNCICDLSELAKKKKGLMPLTVSALLFNIQSKKSLPVNIKRESCAEVPAVLERVVIFKSQRPCVEQVAFGLGVDSNNLAKVVINAGIQSGAAK